MQVRLSSKALKKIVAGSVAGVFFFTTVTEPLAQTNFWADRQSARTAGPASSFADDSLKILRSIAWPKESLNPILGAYRLPSTLGSVVETHPSHASNTPVLLHIQDAHGVYGAQFNASKILEGLRQSGWSDTDGLMVFQEGGAGVAPVDWLSAFPVPDIKERVSRAYLRRGDLTGEEYRALAAPAGAFRLVGVESASLYKANLAARHETAVARSAADRAIADFQTRLSQVKAKTYPDALRTLDRVLDDYDRQRISFVESIQALAAASPKSLNSTDYPNLDRLLRLTEMESRLNPEALAEERDAIVRKLAVTASPEALKQLTERALEVRQGLRTTAAFYEDVLSLADQMRRNGETLATPALRAYVGYLTLSESLKNDALLSESEQLRGNLLARYSNDKKIWRLIQADQTAALERLLWKQEMTPDQYTAYRRGAPVDWSELDRYLTEQETALGLPAASSADLSWTPALAAVRSFYELALDRDAALARNALEELKKAGRARGVLIAGGFHTPGLTRILRDSGAAYAVIQPRFEPDEPARSKKDLRISRDLASLAQPATAREMNRLGGGTANQPLASNGLAMTALSFEAAARTATLSMPKEAALALLKKVGDWRGQDPLRLNMTIYSAFQINTLEAKDLVVFVGEIRGEKFFFVYREAGAGREEQISVLVGEKEISGTNRVNLAGRLPGIVDSRGLASWMQSALRSIKGLTEATSIREAVRKNMPKNMAEATASLLADSIEKAQAPLGIAKEGQAIIDQTASASQVAAQQVVPRLVQSSKTLTDKVLTIGRNLLVFLGLTVGVTGGALAADGAAAVATVTALGPLVIVAVFTAALIGLAWRAQSRLSPMAEARRVLLATARSGARYAFVASLVLAASNVLADAGVETVAFLSVLVAIGLSKRYIVNPDEPDRDGARVDADLAHLEALLSDAVTFQNSALPMDPAKRGAAVFDLLDRTTRTLEKRAQLFTEDRRARLQKIWDSSPEKNQTPLPRAETAFAITPETPRPGQAPTAASRIALDQSQVKSIYRMWETFQEMSGRVGRSSAMENAIAQVAAELRKALPNAAVAPTAKGYFRAILREISNLDASLPVLSRISAAFKIIIRSPLLQLKRIVTALLLVTSFAGIGSATAADMAAIESLGPDVVASAQARGTQTPARVELRTASTPTQAAVAGAVDAPASPATAVSTEAPAPTAAATPDVAQVVTRSSNLNMRAGPGMNAQWTGSLAPGTQVTVKDKSGDWTLVESAGKTGWVSAKYLQAKNSSAAPSAGTKAAASNDQSQQMRPAAETRQGGFTPAGLGVGSTGGRPPDSSSTPSATDDGPRESQTVTVMTLSDVQKKIGSSLGAILTEIDVSRAEAFEKLANRLFSLEAGVAFQARSGEAELRGEMVAMFATDGDKETQIRTTAIDRRILKVLAEREYARVAVQSVELLSDITGGLGVEKIARAEAKIKEYEQLLAHTRDVLIPSGKESATVLPLIQIRLNKARQDLRDARNLVRDQKWELIRLLKLDVDAATVSFQTFTEDEKLQALIEAGANKIAALDIEIALLRKERALAAIPDTFRDETVLSVAVNFAIAAISAQSMGISIPLNLFFRLGISDKEREAVQNAAVWDYARALVLLNQAFEDSVANKENVNKELRSLKTRAAHQSRSFAERSLTAEGIKAQALSVDGAQKLKEYLKVESSLEEMWERAQKLDREAARKETDSMMAGRPQDSRAVGSSPRPDSGFWGQVARTMGRSQIEENLTAIEKEAFERNFPAFQLSNPGLMDIVPTSLGRSLFLNVFKQNVKIAEENLDRAVKSGDPKWDWVAGVGQNATNPFSRTDTVFLFGPEVTLTLSDRAQVFKIKREVRNVKAARLSEAQARGDSAAAMAAMLADLSRLNEDLQSNASAMANVKRTLKQQQHRAVANNEDLTAQIEGSHLQIIKLEENRDALARGITEVKHKIGQAVRRGDGDTLSFDSTYKSGDVGVQMALWRFGSMVKAGPSNNVVLTQEGAKTLAALGVTSAESLKKVEALLASIPDDDANRGDRETLTLLVKQIQDFNALLSGGSRSDLLKLLELSDKAVGAVFLFASLSPSVKWQSSETESIEGLLQGIDSAMMGEFDPHISARLALLSGEALQLASDATAEGGAWKIRLNFVSLLQSLSTKNLSDALASLVGSIQFPTQAAETVLEPLHALARSAGAEDGVGGPNRRARAAEVEGLKAAAEEQFALVRQRQTELLNRRDATKALHRGLADVRDSLLVDLSSSYAILLQRRADLGPDGDLALATLPARENFTQALSVYLDILQLYRKTLSGLVSVELGLVLGGEDPANLPTYKEGKNTLNLDFGAGRANAHRAIEKTLAEMRVRVRKAEEETARILGSLADISIEIGVRNSRPAMSVHIDRSQLRPKKSKPQAELTRAAKEETRVVLTQQASRLQAQYGALISSYYSELVANALLQGPARRIGREGRIRPLRRSDHATILTAAVKARGDMIEAKSGGRAWVKEFASAIGEKTRNGAGLRLVLGLLPDPQALGDINGTLWAPSLGQGSPDQSPEVLQQQALQEWARLNQQMAKAIDSLPSLNLNFENQDGRYVVTLGATWILIGGEGGPKSEIAKADEKAAAAKEADARFRISSNIKAYNEKMNDHMEELRQITRELAALQHPAKFRALVERFQTNQGSAQEIFDHTNEVARLMTKQYGVLIQIAETYGLMAGNLEAYGISMPPVETVLSGFGVPRDRDDFLRTLESFGASPSPVTLSSAQQDLDRRLGPRMTPFRIRYGLKYLSTVPYLTHTSTLGISGGKIEIRHSHKPVPRGDRQLHSQVQRMLDQAGIKAGDDLVLNSADWTFLIKALKTQFNEDDATIADFLRIFPAVLKAFKSTDNEDYPSFLSLNAAQVMSRHFPEYDLLMMDPRVAETVDRALLAKIGMAFHLAQELNAEIRGNPNTAAQKSEWMALRLQEVESFLTLFREHQTKALSADRRLALVARNEELAKRFSDSALRNIPVSTKVRYAKSAQRAAEILFPGITKIKDYLDQQWTPDSRLPRFGNQQLEAIYSALTSYAIANNLRPEDLPGHAKNLQRLFPHFERYLNFAKPEDYANLTDSVELRAVIDTARDFRSTVRSDKTKKEDAREETALELAAYADMVRITQEITRMNTILSMSMYWWNQLVKEQNLSVAQREKAFADFMEVQISYIGNPALADEFWVSAAGKEAAALKKKYGGRLNVLSPSVLGFISGMAGTALQYNLNPDELAARRELFSDWTKSGRKTSRALPAEFDTLAAEWNPRLYKDMLSMVWPAEGVPFDNTNLYGDKYTKSTNIGLYLIALLTARSKGLDTPANIDARISKVLEKIRPLIKTGDPSKGIFPEIILPDGKGGLRAEVNAKGFTSYSMVDSAWLTVALWLVQKSYAGVAGSPISQAAGDMIAQQDYTAHLRQIQQVLRGGMVYNERTKELLPTPSGYDHINSEIGGLVACLIAAGKLPVGVWESMGFGYTKHIYPQLVTYAGSPLAALGSLVLVPEGMSSFKGYANFNFAQTQLAVGTGLGHKNIGYWPTTGPDGFKEFSAHPKVEPGQSPTILATYSSPSAAGLLAMAGGKTAVDNFVGFMNGVKNQDGKLKSVYDPKTGKPVPQVGSLFFDTAYLFMTLNAENTWKIVESGSGGKIPGILYQNLDTAFTPEGNPNRRRVEIKGSVDNPPYSFPKGAAAKSALPATSAPPSPAAPVSETKPKPAPALPSNVWDKVKKTLSIFSLAAAVGLLAGSPGSSIAVDLTALAISAGTSMNIALVAAALSLFAIAKWLRGRAPPAGASSEPKKTLVERLKKPLVTLLAVFTLLGVGADTKNAIDSIRSLPVASTNAPAPSPLVSAASHAANVLFSGSASAQESIGQPRYRNQDYETARGQSMRDLERAAALTADNMQDHQDNVTALELNPNLKVLVEQINQNLGAAQRASAATGLKPAVDRQTRDALVRTIEIYLGEGVRLTQITVINGKNVYESPAIEGVLSDLLVILKANPTFTLTDAFVRWKENRTLLAPKPTTKAGDPVTTQIISDNIELAMGIIYKAGESLFSQLTGQNLEGPTDWNDVKQKIEIEMRRRDRDPSWAENAENPMSGMRSVSRYETIEGRVAQARLIKEGYKTEAGSQVPGLAYAATSRALGESLGTYFMLENSRDEADLLSEMTTLLRMQSVYMQNNTINGVPQTLSRGAYFYYLTMKNEMKMSDDQLSQIIRLDAVSQRYYKEILLAGIKELEDRGELPAGAANALPRPNDFMHKGMAHRLMERGDTDEAVLRQALKDQVTLPMRLVWFLKGERPWYAQVGDRLDDFLPGDLILMAYYQDALRVNVASFKETGRFLEPNAALISLMAKGFLFINDTVQVGYIRDFMKNMLDAAYNNLNNDPGSTPAANTAADGSSLTTDGNLLRSLFEDWITNFGLPPNRARLHEMKNEFKDFERWTHTQEFKTEHPTYVPGDLSRYRMDWLARLGAIYRNFQTIAAETAHRNGLSVDPNFNDSVDIAGRTLVNGISHDVLFSLLDDIPRRDAFLREREREEARMDQAQQDHTAALNAAREQRAAAYAAGTLDATTLREIVFRNALAKNLPKGAQISGGELNSLINLAFKKGWTERETVEFLRIRVGVESVYRTALGIPSAATLTKDQRSEIDGYSTAIFSQWGVVELSAADRGRFEMAVSASSRKEDFVTVEIGIATGLDRLRKTLEIRVALEKSMATLGVSVAPKIMEGMARNAEKTGVNAQTIAQWIKIARLMIEQYKFVGIPADSVAHRALKNADILCGLGIFEDSTTPRVKWTVEQYREEVDAFLAAPGFSQGFAETEWGRAMLSEDFRAKLSENLSERQVSPAVLRVLRWNMDRLVEQYAWAQQKNEEASPTDLRYKKLPRPLTRLDQTLLALFADSTNLDPRGRVQLLTVLADVLEGSPGENIARLADARRRGPENQVNVAAGLDRARLLQPPLPPPNPNNPDQRPSEEDLYGYLPAPKDNVPFPRFGELPVAQWAPALMEFTTKTFTRTVREFIQPDMKGSFWRVGILVTVLVFLVRVFSKIRDFRRSTPPTPSDGTIPGGPQPTSSRPKTEPSPKKDGGPTPADAGSGARRESDPAPIPDLPDGVQFEGTPGQPNGGRIHTYTGAHWKFWRFEVAMSVGFFLNLLFNGLILMSVDLYSISWAVTFFLLASSIYIMYFNPTALVYFTGFVARMMGLFSPLKDDKLMTRQPEDETPKTSDDVADVAGGKLWATFVVAAPFLHQANVAEIVRRLREDSKLISIYFPIHEDFDPNRDGWSGRMQDMYKQLENFNLNAGLTDEDGIPLPPRNVSILTEFGKRFCIPFRMVSTGANVRPKPLPYMNFVGVLATKFAFFRRWTNTGRPVPLYAGFNARIKDDGTLEEVPLIDGFLVPDHEHKTMKIVPIDDPMFERLFTQRITRREFDSQLIYGHGFMQSLDINRPIDRLIASGLQALNKPSGRYNQNDITQVLDAIVQGPTQAILTGLAAERQAELLDAGREDLRRNAAAGLAGLLFGNFLLLQSPDPDKHLQTLIAEAVGQIQGSLTREKIIQVLLGIVRQGNSPLVAGFHNNADAQAHLEGLLGERAQGRISDFLKRDPDNFKNATGILDLIEEIAREKITATLSEKPVIMADVLAVFGSNWQNKISSDQRRQLNLLMVLTLHPEGMDPLQAFYPDPQVRLMDIRDWEIRRPQGAGVHAKWLEFKLLEEEQYARVAGFQPRVVSENPNETGNTQNDSDASEALSFFGYMEQWLLGQHRAAGKVEWVLHNMFDQLLKPTERDPMGPYLSASIRSADTWEHPGRVILTYALTLTAAILVGYFGGILWGAAAMVLWTGIVPTWVQWNFKYVDETGTPYHQLSHDEGEGLFAFVVYLWRTVMLDTARGSFANHMAVWFKWFTGFDTYTMLLRHMRAAGFDVPGRYYNNLVLRGILSPLVWIMNLVLGAFLVNSPGLFGIALPFMAESLTFVFVVVMFALHFLGIAAFHIQSLSWRGRLWVGFWFGVVPWFIPLSYVLGSMVVLSLIFAGWQLLARIFPRWIKAPPGGDFHVWSGEKIGDFKNFYEGIPQGRRDLVAPIVMANNLFRAVGELASSSLVLIPFITIIFRMARLMLYKSFKTFAEKYLPEWTNINVMPKEETGLHYDWLYRPAITIAVILILLASAGGWGAFFNMPWFQWDLTTRIFVALPFAWTMLARYADLDAEPRLRRIFRIPQGKSHGSAETWDDLSPAEKFPGPDGQSRPWERFLYGWNVPILFASVVGVFSLVFRVATGDWSLGLTTTVAVVTGIWVVFGRLHRRYAGPLYPHSTYKNKWDRDPRSVVRAPHKSRSWERYFYGWMSPALILGAALFAPYYTFFLEPSFFLRIFTLLVPFLVAARISWMYGVNFLNSPGRLRQLGNQWHAIMILIGATIFGSTLLYYYFLESFPAFFLYLMNSMSYATGSVLFGADSFTLGGLLALTSLSTPEYVAMASEILKTHPLFVLATAFILNSALVLGVPAMLFSTLHMFRYSFGQIHPGVGSEGYKRVSRRAVRMYLGGMVPYFIFQAAQLILPVPIALLVGLLAAGILPVLWSPRYNRRKLEAQLIKIQDPNNPNPENYSSLTDGALIAAAARLAGYPTNAKNIMTPEETTYASRYSQDILRSLMDELIIHPEDPITGRPNRRARHALELELKVHILRSGVSVPKFEELDYRGLLILAGQYANVEIDENTSFENWERRASPDLARVRQLLDKFIASVPDITWLRDTQREQLTSAIRVNAVSGNYAVPEGLEDMSDEQLMEFAGNQAGYSDGAKSQLADDAEDKKQLARRIRANTRFISNQEQIDFPNMNFQELEAFARTFPGATLHIGHAKAQRNREAETLREMIKTRIRPIPDNLDTRSYNDLSVLARDMWGYYPDAGHQQADAERVLLTRFDRNNLLLLLDDMLTKPRTPNGRFDGGPRKALQAALLTHYLDNPSQRPKLPTGKGQEEALDRAVYELAVNLARIENPPAFDSLKGPKDWKPQANKSLATLRGRIDRMMFAYDNNRMVVQGDTFSIKSTNNPVPQTLWTQLQDRLADIASRKQTLATAVAAILSVTMLFMAGIDPTLAATGGEALAKDIAWTLGWLAAAIGLPQIIRHGEETKAMAKQFVTKMRTAGLRVAEFGRRMVAVAASGIDSTLKPGPLLAVAAIVTGVIAVATGSTGLGLTATGLGAAKLALPSLFIMAVAMTTSAQSGLIPAPAGGILGGLNRIFAPMADGFFRVKDVQIPTGRAVVLDLGGAVVADGKLTVPTAIVTAFANQISKLQGVDAKASVAVEIRLPAGAPEALRQPDTLKSEILKLLDGVEIDGAVYDRMAFAVLGDSPSAVEARLRDLSSTHLVQVVTDDRGAAFWQGLNLPLTVLVAFINSLMKVDTVVVLTGELAEQAIKNGAKADANGNVRFEKIGTPLDSLGEQADKNALMQRQA